MAGEMQLPRWCLGAGAVAETVGNLRHGFAPADGIKDHDLVHASPRDEEDLGAPGGDRLVLHPPGHDVDLSGSECHVLAAEADGRHA